MAKKFAEHKGLNLTEVNNQILKAWEQHDIFHRSIDEREGCPQFVFFEGPPSVDISKIFQNPNVLEPAI